MKQNNLDIAFVILHYNTIEDTENCAKSIVEYVGTEQYAIIIVDNASPNKTGLVLQKKYNEKEKHHVILSKENLGFARGNNLGINYAREELGANFVCCLNNDTLLIQKNFWHRIEKEFKRSEFAVMAPRVLDINNKTQLYFGKLYELEDYKRELLKLRDLMEGPLDTLDMEHKSKARKIVEKFPLGNYFVYLVRLYKNRALSVKEDEMLHGCFLIFSPLYFKKYDGFYDKTFMYYEEELLYLRVREARMRTVYQPAVKIKHLEDSATNSVYTSNEQKNRFVVNCKIESVQKLIEYMSGNVK